MVALVVCLAYFSILLLAREYLVWGIDVGLLRAQIANLLAEINSYPPVLQSGSAVSSAKELLTKTQRDLKRTWPRRLFTSGAAEMAAWDALHEAKRLIVTTWEWPQVRVRLDLAVIELQGIRDEWADEAEALAMEIRALISGPPTARVTDKVQQTARAALARALRILYSVENQSDREITEWHNKIFFISSCALLFIVVLAMTFGKPDILLLGALGGFMSKLVRLRTRGDVPRDYDAYWTTLFVSAPLGALVACAGLLLTNVLQNAEILGSAFKGISNHEPAVAFLFGFSEPLFDKIIARTSKLADSAGLERGVQRERAARRDRARLEAVPAPAPLHQQGGRDGGLGRAPRSEAADRDDVGVAPGQGAARLGGRRVPGHQGRVGGRGEGAGDGDPGAGQRPARRPRVTVRSFRAHSAGPRPKRA